MNAFCDRLGLIVPVIQAPMAGVSTPALAAAVSNAGGLGSISVGAASVAEAERAIDDLSSRTNRAVNINVFCHRPAIAQPVRDAAWCARFRPLFARYGVPTLTHLREIYTSFAVDEAMVELLVQKRPAVVSFHFGLPSTQVIAALHEVGTILLSTATSTTECEAAEAAGIDAVVAQGYEAGGHRGCFDENAPDDRLSTLALTRLLVERQSLPVIAAGGIMDGASIATALSLGAAAAQLGTAFICCAESSADRAYREALASDAAYHTQMIRALSGRPARCLANAFTRFAETVDDAEVPSYPLAYDLGKTLHAAAKAHGESGFGAQWAGQGAPRIRPMRAADLIATLAGELAAFRSGKA